MQITVTLDHIAKAKPTPSRSPIALALQELGYSEASVTHRYAYFNAQVYPLPEIAIANEIHFDFVAKQGSVQGETTELIEYTFELETKQAREE
jgi:hypothetical protein